MLWPNYHWLIPKCTADICKDQKDFTGGERITKQNGMHRDMPSDGLDDTLEVFSSSSGDGSALTSYHLGRGESTSFPIQAQKGLKGDAQLKDVAPTCFASTCCVLLCFFSPAWQQFLAVGWGWRGLLAAQPRGRAARGESWCSTMGRGGLRPTREPVPEQGAPLPLSVHEETWSCKSWKSRSPSSKFHSQFWNRNHSFICLELIWKWQFFLWI